MSLPALCLNEFPDLVIRILVANGLDLYACNWVMGVHILDRPRTCAIIYSVGDITDLVPLRIQTFPILPFVSKIV